MKAVEVTSLTIARLMTPDVLARIAAEEAEPKPNEPARRMTLDTTEEV